MRILRRTNGKKSLIARGLLILTGLAVFLSGSGSALSAQTQTAVIATVEQDWSGGAHSVISVDPVGGPRSVQNDLLPTSTSDIAVSAYGQYFYRIEKFQADNVTKFDINSPATVIWQYSTMDPGEVASSNPCDLIFVNSEKAYLMRYGSTKAWIVNPSTTTQSGFKTGELDLNSYADADGPPEMVSGVIAGGKLFIILQRLESWCPSNTAYVAVFDIATDTEIDTGMGEGGRKGIPLSIKDPVGIQYLSENNTVYVVGVGAYPGFCPPIYDYTGGIISINPVTYVTAMIIDDGDAEHHPYGVLSGMFLVSPTQGYFVGYEGWGDNSLYTFDPSTGTVGGPLPKFKNISISGMQSGLGLDKNGMLWVCNQTKDTINIMDTKDNIIDESINTNLRPQNVVFCTEGAPSPTADFTGLPTIGAAPLTVRFTDESTGAVTSWSWDFGDSSSPGTEKNPTHTYNEPDIYTVSLTVTGPGGTDTKTKTDYITAGRILYVNCKGDCGGKQPCYDSIQDAVDVAENGATIKIAEGVCAEDVVLDNPSALILQGGWDAAFTTQSSTSSILSLSISRGSAVTEYLVIQ